MSVYKVISNYYNDLLNFLTREASKSKGGLTDMFQSITPDKKKIIVTKLADMMLKFDMAFNSEIAYWNTNKKEQTWFMIIYILMLIISFVITVMMFVFKMQEIQKDGGSTFNVLKSGISHLIAYQIILTVFIILIINIRATQKLCVGQISLLKEDLKLYSNYVFTGAHRDQMSKLFAFIGYWRRNNKMRYKTLYKDIKADSSYDTVLSLFDINVSSNEKKDAPVKNIGKEVEIYDTLKTDIESSLIRFYNNGDGYTDVKKLVLLSSPILMLKEARRIMNYYSFLGYKKHSEVKDVAETKTKESINTLIITPINSLIHDFNSPQQIDSSEITRLVTLNEQNTQYKSSIDKLLRAFSYLATFCYPIYIKTSDTDPQFPQPELLMYMPQNINTERSTGDEKKFLDGVKLVFTKVYTSDYQNYMQNVQNVSDTKNILSELCTTFAPLFKELYYEVFINLQGGAQFPFSREYIIPTIKNKLKPLYIPSDYQELITDIMFVSVVQNVSKNFDILSVKREFLVESISTSLVPTNINILKYQNYIVNTIIETNSSAKAYVDDVIELINHIQKSLTIKKQIAVTQELKNEQKFNELDDFKDILLNTSFSDLSKQLEVNFFQNVIEQFYASISESVNLKSPNLRNIYYQRQKNFKVWKLTVIMIIVAMVLLLVRFTLSLVDEKKYLKYVKPDKECDAKFASEDYRNRNANWYIKLVLPLFIMVFIIAMLISFYKKMQSTFEFNIEIIENNTNELKNVLDDLSKKMQEIDDKLDPSERVLKIESVAKITESDKNDLLDFIKKTLDKFEKCNYIMESAKNQIPFPYTEVIMHGFMMTMSIAAVMYVIAVFAPIKRLKDVKILNKFKEKLSVAENMDAISSELKSMSTCHGEDMDSIVFSLKIIFFAFIIMFLMFYSVKIITTANDFKMGLYNSAYFEESECYNN